jgi:hypothetical protein
MIIPGNSFRLLGKKPLWYKILKHAELRKITAFLNIISRHNKYFYIFVGTKHFQSCPNQMKFLAGCMPWPTILTFLPFKGI